MMCISTAHLFQVECQHRYASSGARFLPDDEHSRACRARIHAPADFRSAEATNAVVKAAEQAAASDSPTKAAKPTDESRPAPEPVLVDQAFARKYFPNQNPVGLHIGNAQRDEPATGPQPGYRIMGIAGDTKYSRLRRDIMPTMFLPQVGDSAHSSCVPPATPPH